MKTKVLRIIVEIVIGASIILTFIIINRNINKNRENTFYLINDGSEYAYQVEKMFIEGEDLVIQGWFFELKSVKNQEREVKDNSRLEILLYDINTLTEKDLDGNDKPKHGIHLDTIMNNREDVNEYFKCEYDYSHCGFTGRINKKSVDLENTNYQVIFKTDENDKYGIGSSYYINEGRLMHVAPSEEVFLDIEGTDIEDIIHKGIYVGGSTEYHIYIYQYDWKLYYIVDNEKFFDNDITFIELMMDTTQFDKLPSYRTDNGWYWGNIGGSFEEYEITDKMNCGKYRVSVRSIPTEHSVTVISTGQHVDGKWIWQSMIRPVYNFEEID